MNLKTNILGILVLLTTSQVNAAELRLFQTQGCAYEPKGINIESINSCCIAQQLKYWQGGRYAQRKQANNNLYTCVLSTTGDKDLASLMKKKETHSAYSLLPNRWGNGWKWGKFYNAITTEEKDLIIKDLKFMRDSTTSFLQNAGY